jgi:hypothetical protein
MKTTGASAGQSLPKSPTGIQGLDEITPVAGCPRGGPRSSVAVRHLSAADHFAAAGSPSLRGARSPRHRAARREARQQGGLRRHQRARLRFPVYGQEQLCFWQSLAKNWRPATPRRAHRRVRTTDF